MSINENLVEFDTRTVGVSPTQPRRGSGDRTLMLRENRLTFISHLGSPWGLSPAPLPEGPPDYSNGESGDRSGV